MADKPRLGSGGDRTLFWVKDTRKEEESPPQKTGKRRQRKRDTGKPRAEKLTRASFTLRESYLKKMRLQALRDRKQLKDILDDILTKYYKGKKITLEE